MLSLGGSAEDDHRATPKPPPPPVVAAPSSQTEATRVPEPSSGEVSPAGSHPVGGGDRAAPDQVGAKGRPGRSGPSAEEDRRRRRPESAEDGAAAAMAEEIRGEEEYHCAREKLKRHRVAMAGRVWIPETWGQESLLKDWADCAAVDRALVPSGLVSAREALVEECRRPEPGAGFRIESGCLSA